MTMDKVEAVNRLLREGELHNIIVDDHTGFAGYRPQSIIDNMNAVFGIGGWGFHEVESFVEPGEKGSLAIFSIGSRAYRGLLKVPVRKAS
jgi:hypothetical protein